MSVPQRAPTGDRRIIRASEIGRYAYCAHAWWLGSIQELPSSRHREMVEGEAAHLHHGRQLRTSLYLQRLAIAVLLFAVLVGIVGLAHGL